MLSLHPTIKRFPITTGDEKTSMGSWIELTSLPVFISITVILPSLEGTTQYFNPIRAMRSELASLLWLVIFDSMHWLFCMFDTLCCFSLSFWNAGLFKISPKQKHVEYTKSEVLCLHCSLPSDETQYTQQSWDPIRIEGFSVLVQYVSSTGSCTGDENIGAEVSNVQIWRKEINNQNQ